MPRRALAASALLLLLAGCSRDLTIPDRNQLGIEPAFASVAPRESVTVAGVGGAGGYTYAFAAGGRLSGDDATIDPATGQYQAGAAGSAQDVVVVTDAAGKTAEARITVGARLTASPSVALLSPGETLVPVVAGGRPPYAFSLAPGAGSTGALDDTGTYTAGAEGDVVDEIVVSDATADPAATAVVELHVGARLRIYPPAAAVAPGEHLPFVALGGRAPYAFAIASAQSGAPTISPTGEYVAGANGAGGTATDVVRITDDLGQVSDAVVTVGPPLSLSLPVAIVQPGVPLQLAAAGGKAPYAFGFRPHGNRSHGSVDLASGAYVPGENYGAQDLLQVRDATGTVVPLSPDPIVGPSRFEVGVRPERGAAADLNGDGRDDAIVLRYDPGNSQALLDLTVFSRPARREPLATTYYLPPGHGTDPLLVADLDGDGHDELRFVGGGKATPLVPDLAGNLSLGTTVNVPFSPPFSAAPVSGGLRIYTTQLCTTAAPAAGFCVYDWPVGQPSPPVTACTCLGVPRTSGRTVRGIAAGDVNGDGVTDLAWTEDIDASGYAKALGVAFGAGAPAAFPATPSAWMTLPAAPGGFFYRFDTPFWDPEGAIQLFPGGVGAFISISNSNARLTHLWHVGEPSGQVVDPFGGGYGGAMGFRPTSGGVLVYGYYYLPFAAGYAWSDVAGLWEELPAVVSADAPLADGMWGVALPDLDGDGATDLVAPSSATGAAWVYPGDGSGAFGTRARFSGPSTPGAVATGDLDGDGHADAVVGTDLPGLTVLWGGDHQLAFGGESRVDLAAAALALGDFQGDGGLAALVVDQGGSATLHPLAADGTVGAKIPMTGVSLTGFLPPRIAPSRTGGDAGLGFWGVSGGGNAGVNYYYPMVFSRAGATGFTSTQAYPGVSSPLSSTYRCASGPAARADGGGVLRVKEMVELCTSDYQNIDLWRAGVLTWSPFRFKSCAWNDPVCAWGSGPVASRAGTGSAQKAGVSFAGQLPDGTAVFVGSTGAAAAPVQAWAVAVTANAVDGGALGLAWFDLGTLPGPVEGSALGLLSTADGWPDLAVSAGGRVHVFLDGSGSLSTGSGALSPLAGVGAAGRTVGIAPLASGTAGDVLILAGEDLVPLRNDGTGALR
jgi:hypothetical protein